MTTDIDWDAEPVPNLSSFDTYEQAREGFEWEIPETYNIGVDVTRHADDRGRVALFTESAAGERDQFPTVADGGPGAVRRDVVNGCLVGVDGDHVVSVAVERLGHARSKVPEADDYEPFHGREKCV